MQQPPPPPPASTDDPFPITTTVLIVGAGPTGLTLAIDLANRKIPHILIDTLTTRSPYSKAVTLHARTLELLHSLSPALTSHLQRQSYTSPGFDFGLYDHECGDDGEGGLRDLESKFPFVLVLPQFCTEEALERTYVELGGRIWRGLTLLESQQDGGGVTCVCEVGEGNTVPFGDLFADEEISIMGGEGKMAGRSMGEGEGSERVGGAIAIVEADAVSHVEVVHVEDEPAIDSAARLSGMARFSYAVKMVDVDGGQTVESESNTTLETDGSDRATLQSQPTSSPKFNSNGHSPMHFDDGVGFGQDHLFASPEASSLDLNVDSTTTITASIESSPIATTSEAHSTFHHRIRTVSCPDGQPPHPSPVPPHQSPPEHSCQEFPTRRVHFTPPTNPKTVTASPLPPRPSTNPKRLIIRSEYLCGADGTRSRVRTLYDIPFEGYPYPFVGMMGDVRLSKDYFVAGVTQFSAPEGVATVIPFRDGIYRVVTMVWPTGERKTPPSSIDALEAMRGRRSESDQTLVGDGKDGMEDAINAEDQRKRRVHETTWIPDGFPSSPPTPTLDDLQETVNTLLSPTTTPPTLLHPVWLTTWGAERRLARRFQLHRVFLLGDAAHVNAPVGGQGMNTGIQDAINLGWKLAGVVQGVSPDRVLRTYEKERREIAARVNEVCDRLVWVNMVRNPVLRLARGAVGIAMRREVVGMLSGVGVSYRGVLKDIETWMYPPPCSHLKRLREIPGTLLRTVKSLSKSTIRTLIQTLTHLTHQTYSTLTWARPFPQIISPQRHRRTTQPHHIIQPGDRVPDADLISIDSSCPHTTTTQPPPLCTKCPATHTNLHTLFTLRKTFHLILYLTHRGLHSGSLPSRTLFTPDALLDFPLQRRVGR
ncbi:hypothetical protein HDU67_006231, partial [Dinochytrium kinnereticum]